MSIPVIAGVIAVGVSLALRERTRDPGMPGSEVLVLAGSLSLALVGLLATALGLAGWFRPWPLAATLVCAASVLFPWTQRPLSKTSFRLHPRAWVLPLLIVIGGVALRMPPNDYSLAGRDQGTYQLRAQQLVDSGRFEATDPILAAVGSSSRVGAADLRGLYRTDGQSWRENRYEGPYRPGWYVADRERGRVVPQFFHLHPSLLAVSLLSTGSSLSVVLLVAALGLLAVFCVARRLWPNPTWALLAAGLLTVHPLSIWVGRTALSEVPTGLFLAAAFVAVLRSGPLEDVPDGSELTRGALLLGAIAWVRGNGWLWAPVVLALLWFVPARTVRRRGPALAYLVTVVLAVAVHATTAFPYVYDELHRMIDWLGPVTPGRIIVATSVLAVAWLSIDELSFARSDPRRTRAVLRYGPKVLLALAVAAVGIYLALRGDATTRPFSRLDPALALLGLPLLVAAAFGAADVAFRVRLRGGTGIWALALTSIVVLTLGLYARRNLPQLGLYYYGRYLVPELLPVACLLGVHAVKRLYDWIRGAQPWRSRRGLVAMALATLLGAGLAWSSAGIVVTHPTARLNEFADADQLLAGLTQRLPADAVVVAGGEGWHAGHTFNQVGGALQAGYGVDIVPYRTREAAYASLYDLLVRGPAETGADAPAVYLLVNEATHHMRRPQDKSLVAAFDAQLWPPLRATEMVFTEMFVDRLTPVTDAVPTRVTRDELRMALIRVEVDPDHRGEHMWSVVDPGDGLEVTGGAGIVDGARCLSTDTPVRLELRDAPSGPGALVLVAAPGTARHNARVTVRFDGRKRGLDPPRMALRERDTIGPLVAAEPPPVIEVLGFPKPTDAPCRHGGLLEVRWLERPPTTFDWRRGDAVTYGPTRDLGHPVHPTGWVPGLGLGRYRPGVRGVDKLVGMAMRLVPETPLQFEPELLPEAPEGLDVIVTLTGTRLTQAAQLVLTADGETIATFTPPGDRKGSWQTPPTAWTPSRPFATFELRLQGASPGDWVLVRDIGLFSRESPRLSAVAPDPRL